MDGRKKEEKKVTKANRERKGKKKHIWTIKRKEIVLMREGCGQVKKS